MVRVGNLNELSTSLRHIESHKVGKPSLYLSKRGCLVKTSLAKTFLREKRPSEEKEYTWGYKYWFDYNTHLAEVELEMGYIPCVGNLFPRQLF